MNLASFADLAVRLVNSGVCDADADPLRSCEAFREFVAGRPFFAVPVTQHDLDRLRLLRGELATVFTSAVDGEERAAAGALLQLGVSVAAVISGSLECVGAADALPHLARAEGRTTGWHQQCL